MVMSAFIVREAVGGQYLSTAGGWTRLNTDIAVFSDAAQARAAAADNAAVTGVNARALTIEQVR